MEGLAPELLDNIFTSACTDGGFTGCSLSSVSKHFRATSRAARFHSVSLTGSPQQPTQFLSCFLRERAVAAIRTPTIRHLYLVVMKKETPWRAPDEVQRELRQIAIQTARYIEDVASLFRLVAQDLETLCLVHNHGWLGLVQLPAIASPAGGFPMLRELTLVGSDPFTATGAALSPFYPRLERLHLGFPTYFPWDISFDSWATRAPRVTHLCLSEVNGAPPAVVEAVDVSRPKFKNLRHLIMRPVGPPARPEQGRAQQDHEFMLEVLGLFCETAAIFAEVLPNGKSPYDWEATAKQEWVDWLAGGNGCCVFSEEVALQDSTAGSEPRPRLEWADLVARVRHKKEAEAIARMEKLIAMKWSDA
ncbi:hypothetical protein K466DRAFT_658410 [Polyporus arcularius HHB13444]|uniref:F-box domain-containing protein n=1 Tax=Polyporus arcularius HHB13444 TaxID=1314778 RepID=A0A5C3Q5A0_9APHY|nr:hypothetical protein K466DRAFT_658410 [Polyporus arcularius HHB13444]